ncbi:MAG: hypothetical protein WBG36_11875 [Ornithinimicrobium sp.]
MSTVAFEESNPSRRRGATTSVRDRVGTPGVRLKGLPVDPSGVIALQRCVGNSAVARLVADKGVEGEDEPLKDGAPAEKVAYAQGARDDGEKAHGREDLAIQRQVPPPAPAAPPVGLASLNFLPVLKDKVPAGWGVTTEDDAIFDITPYMSGGSWKCVITQADQQAHQGVRLLPGVTEVTAALVGGSACGSLGTMKKSLKDVADQKAASGFYMLSAVQAHEDLHITQYRNALSPAYPGLKTAVEALTLPAASAPNLASAKAAIKALPAYTTAIATFNAADVAANNATASHSPMAPFSTAEHAVVDPMIVTIDARRTTLKCP